MLAAVVAHSAVQVQSENPKNWGCSYGDYHMTLTTAEGSPSFNFRICEFYTCDPSTLMQNAKFVTSIPNEQKYLYETPNVSAEELLILKYDNKQNLDGIDVKIGGFLAGSFNQCYLIGNGLIPR